MGWQRLGQSLRLLMNRQTARAVSGGRVERARRLAELMSCTIVAFELLPLLPLLPRLPPLLLLLLLLLLPLPLLLLSS